MTPGARIATAIELLARIEALDRPADGVLRGYLRGRRYIGSKDRRAISDLVYGVLRARARLDWRLGRVAPGAGGARARAIAYLVLQGDRSPDDLTGLFDDGRYHPPALSDPERAFAAALAGQGLDHPEQPDQVRGEMPDWLLPSLREGFGDVLAPELAALLPEAPLDLRVNTLKTDREAARAALAEAGVAARPTPLSPLGLRLESRQVLPNLSAFRDGLVEVQDEGSQIVALLTDARPGMNVADLCAGAGGKALALAASMAGEGSLVALDRDARRLGRAGPRLQRAGLTEVEVELRALGGADDPWLGQAAGGFDRVLIDAPCTGSGAWRRSPDARWRLTAGRLEEYLAMQREALELGAGLVAPGGRLVYATCSLLPEENGQQAARFLEAHPEFALLPVAEVWAETLGGACPAGEETLLLTPARHGTDGFFVAVFRRLPEP